MKAELDSRFMKPKRALGPSRPIEINLRPVTKSDLPTLYEHQWEPDAYKMSSFLPRGLDSFMTHWTRILSDETVVAMAVVVDACLAGYVGSWTQDGQRLVGYWIGKEYWGKGVATQMLSMFLRLIADRPLHAQVARQNVASIRVLEKCGFTLCPEPADSLKDPAKSIDELVYVV